MDSITEFSDDRLKSICIHCSTELIDLIVTRDHVPSKSFLAKPSPDNLPVVAICRNCNHGFSLDEEYMVALLSIVMCGSTSPLLQSDERVQRMLERNPGLRRRIEQSKREYTTIGGERKTVWMPEQARIERIVVKNARGHAFYELAEPIFDKPTYARYMPINNMTQEQRNKFEQFETCPFPVWPEIGSRMMSRICTQQDMEGDWVIVQEGIYRYAIHQGPPTIVRTVIHEYLATEVRWDIF